MNCHVSIAHLQQALTFCLSCFTWLTPLYIHSILCHYLGVRSGLPDLVTSQFVTISFHSRCSHLSSVIPVESLGKKKKTVIIIKIFELHVAIWLCSLLEFLVSERLVNWAPDLSHFFLTISFSLKFYCLFIMSRSCTDWKISCDLDVLQSSSL